MAQITSGIRKVLSSPAVYELVQRALGASKGRRRFVERYVRASPNQSVLDIGCGTAELLNLLPTGISYTGYDISETYIQHAESKYSGRGKFHVKVFDSIEAKKSGLFDIAIAIGLLHHLDDDEAHRLMVDIKSALRPEGRFIAIDPCYEKGQNLFAKALIDMDRGQNVRTQLGYRKVASSVFNQVRSTVEHKCWVPYTHHILECS